MRLAPLSLAARGGRPSTGYLSSASGFSSLRKPSVRGTYKYRVLWLGDTDHAPSATGTLTLYVT